jgi:drug/metabolite transporter (DMT)-like permease
MSPIARGSIVAIVAAVLFGVTTPLVHHFGRGVGAFATACLLYAGAALGAVVRRRRAEETRLARSHVPRLLLVAAFGAVLAPAAFAWGLQETGGLATSLLLNLEAPITVLLAFVFYREPIGKRVLVACALMAAGGILLSLRLREGGAWNVLGVAAVTIATLCWALDNTLTRPLADFDPRSVVLWKAAIGATLAALVALVFGEPWPSAWELLALLGCGATGYGFSLQLYLRAQRVVGAARTGSLFASAPFVGAALALALGDRSGAALIVPASALFASAVYLHVSERHGHWHVHHPIVHDHPHTHDDGHHTHRHFPAVKGSHSHSHEHESLEHEHPHGSDVHHRHRHE